MAHERDNEWQDATIDGPDGGRIVVDVAALLVEAHAAAEMTIAHAQETLHPDGRPFVFKGPGWYQYQHDAILVAPCSRRSGAGDQHYLFSIFLGAAENVRQAMAWAATAPTRPTPAPDDEASGPASGFRLAGAGRKR